MKNFIIYMLALVLSIYLNIMFVFPIGNALIGAEIALLCICVAQAYYLRGKISVQMEQQGPIIETGDEAEVQVCIMNGCKWSAADVVLVFCYIQNGKVEEKRKKVSLQINGVEKGCASVYIKGEMCGQVKIVLKELWVYDCFHLTCCRKQKKNYSEVLVLPRIYSVGLQISEKTRMFPMDGEEYSKHQSGDDPSEVFDVRTYREGDRIQNIHWKLSARKDEVYVKEYSRPIGACVLLALEGGGTALGGTLGAAYVEAAVSISNAILLAKCPHYVAFKPKGDSLERVHVRNRESLQELIQSVLRLLEDAPQGDVYESYEEVYMDASLCTVVTLTSNLEIYVNEEMACHLNEASLEASFREVTLEI